MLSFKKWLEKAKSKFSLPALAGLLPNLFSQGLFSYGLELVVLNSIGNIFKTVSKPTSGELAQSVQPHMTLRSHSNWSVMFIGSPIGFACIHQQMAHHSGLSGL